MCLILFAYRMSPDRPLVVAANRDEFYARPALAAHHWEDAPHVYGGRDLEAQGTWLGVSTLGRFAAVTNFTNAGDASPPPGSRGDLPRFFLEGTERARDYVAAVDGDYYRGFNLLAFDGEEMAYTCNRTGETRVLEPGVYGLTNTRLGDEWPKALRGAAALTEIAALGTTGDLLQILLDDHVPPDSELPHRDRDIELERRVAPCFIRGDAYGTRASTAVIFNDEGIEFVEQLYGAMGEPGDRISRVLAREA